MRKLVLVDDEASVRQTISQLIDWEAYGFQLVGSASNGEDALSIIEEQQPDVVITDICMPLMDGFELSQAIYELDPTIKIIFISGHDNFDFAQSAIRLNIHEYLLKPISPADIQAALVRVNQSLDQELQRATDMRQMTKEYMHTIEASKRSLLIDLVTENYAANQTSRLLNLIQLYTLQLDQAYYRIVTFAVQQADDQSTVIQSISSDAKDLLFAEELTWVSYRKTLAELCQKHLHAEVFRYNQNLILILNSDQPITTDITDVLLQDIQQTFLKIYRLPITLGVSDESTQISELKRLYRQALQTLDYCQATSALNRMYYSDMDKNHRLPLEHDYVNDNRFNSLITVGLYSELEQYMRRFYDEQINRNVTQDVMFLSFLEFTSRTIRVASRIIQNESLFTEFMKTMMDSPHVPAYELLAIFLKYSKQILNEIHQNRESEKESLTQAGLKLMHRHYNDPEFNQRELAKRLHISPNYLCSVFKKEANASFKELLIEIRMQKAQELILTTDMKMLEIAEAVGYTDHHYFSYSFKKFFGKSPRAMREPN